MNIKSYILVPGLCKWVTSSTPLPLLLSSPAGRRNEVVLSSVEECYFGQQVLEGLYWPWVSVDHSGLGHHQGAPVNCDSLRPCKRPHGLKTSASRGAPECSKQNMKQCRCHLYAPFWKANVLDLKDLTQSTVKRKINKTGTYNPRWVSEEMSEGWPCQGEAQETWNHVRTLLADWAKIESTSMNVFSHF